ncbi:MAG: LPXTG cell wall anchor domain-containing protein [Acidimicrobiia bacterium]
MGTFVRRILAVAGVALLATMFAGTAIASAQAEEYPPPTTVPGDLNVPPTVQVGGEVAVSGDSCGPNQPVTIRFNGTPVGTATTDANGHFATSFKVPAGTTPGVYTVTAENEICVLGASVTVQPAAAALAFTGSSSTVPTLWVGVGLVALGAGLVFVARRRLSGARLG